jgi:hypothetical protein
MTNLSPNLPDAKSCAITVMNNDIYVCGYEYESNGSKYVAKYWKNGSMVNLSNGTHDAYGISIFVQ